MKLARAVSSAGWGLASALSAAALVRAVRPERSVLDVAVTAAAPVLLAPSWLVLAAAVGARQRRLAVFSAALAGYHLYSSRVPRKKRAGTLRNSEGEPVRVVFANILYSNRHIESAFASLAVPDNDVVALAEVTHAHAAAIERFFPPSEFPGRLVAMPGPRTTGMAVLSRTPLENARTWTSQDHPELDVVVRTRGGRRFRLLAVHTWAPVSAPALRRWRAQLDEIGARASSPPIPGGAGSPTTQEHRSGPTAGAETAAGALVVGDLNATVQHRSLARLTARGLADASHGAPPGWHATWPANRWWCPPFLGLDHVLAGPGIVVRRASAERVPGSDHRAVAVVAVLPVAPPS